MDLSAYLDYLTGLNVRAFAHLSWPGWLQGFVLVVLVAVLAYGFTNVTKHLAIFARPSLKAKAQDKETWQWTWRGVAGLWGMGWTLLLAGPEPLWVVVGAVVGLGSSWLYREGKALLLGRLERFFGAAAR